MKIRKLSFFLVVVLGLALFSRAAHAVDQKAADAVINQYLASQKSGESDAQSQDSAIGDLNGDGKPEIVLLWVTLGPTYSSTSLTVFADVGKGYTPAASLGLTGQADKVLVKSGVILVDQMLPGKNDPLCCPSLKKQGKFRWTGKKILELN
jgi:hypothetical protein